MITKFFEDNDVIVKHVKSKSETVSQTSRFEEVITIADKHSLAFVCASNVTNYLLETDEGYYHKKLYMYHTPKGTKAHTVDTLDELNKICEKFFGYNVYFFKSLCK